MSLLVVHVHLTRMAHQCHGRRRMHWLRWNSSDGQVVRDQRLDPMSIHSACSLRRRQTLFQDIAQPLEWDRRCSSRYSSAWNGRSSTFYAFTAFCIGCLRTDFTVEKFQNRIDQTLFASLLLGHIWKRTRSIQSAFQDRIEWTANEGKGRIKWRGTLFTSCSLVW